MSSTELIPQEFRAGAEEAARAAAALQDALIAAHVNLDGDALGSMAAAGRMLQTLGRRCALYAPRGVPEKLAFLPLPSPVYRDLDELPFRPKSALLLDCGEPARLGPQLAEKIGEWPSINIDHHPGSDGMGSLCNYIDPRAAACAQLVGYVALALKMPLAGDLGEALGLGLMTDTGGFCHGNTTADVFEMCALLSRRGCDFGRLRETLQHDWSLEKLHLFGALFEKAALELDGRLALCVVTLEELERRRCGPEDVEGLAEWLRRLRKAKIAAIIREEEPQECKVSLRSYGETDARAIAASLGGGGHRNAAGAMIHASPAKARETLLRAVEAYFRQGA